MKKILFVGETCTISQTYTKGYDHVTISRYAEAGRSMVDALKENGIDIELFPIHLAHSNFLDTLETLNQYSVVIFSDIGSNTFLVPPQTHANAVRMPNRLKLIKEYVSRGGGFLMCGGYLSFTGYEGKARYGMTPIADILPVEMLPYDDRIECPEGIFPRVLQPDHPILKGIESNWPDFLGYNRVKAKAQASVILGFENQDVLLAVQDYQNGRPAAFASDTLPHWATPEFIHWKSYTPFFTNLLHWLSKD
jgi:uncharacterized membrane protein